MGTLNFIRILKDRDALKIVFIGLILLCDNYLEPHDLRENVIRTDYRNNKHFCNM